MRRTLTLCRTGLAGAAAVVLLTACGGGSSDDSASSSSSKTSSSSSSSSSSSAAAADTEFCQQAATLDEDLAGLTNASDPSQLAPALQQVSQRLHQLTPPAEIADDWNTLVGAIDQLAQAAAATDFTNQQQAAAFAQTASQLESQLGPASTNVENYLSNQCGIDTGGTESSAPSS
jgi:hypothetical protein